MTNEARRGGADDMTPNDAGSSNRTDDDATSDATLSDIEEDEELTDENVNPRSPSPDGTFDEPASGRPDGSDSGGPM
jgi:hypothetical protein